MGGSFNPVHIGHLLLADYLVRFSGLDEVWMTLSPVNPLKAAAEGSTEADRLAMLTIACKDVMGVKPCDIELSLPRPSYTAVTLRKLAEMNPDYEFHLVIGADNWYIFDRWRDYKSIIRDFAPVIYPRPGYEIDRSALPEGVRIVDAPVFEVSSTMIRDAIAAGHDMRLYLPAGVGEYVKYHNLYGSNKNIEYEYSR